MTIMVSPMFRRIHLLQRETVKGSELTLTVMCILVANVMFYPPRDPHIRQVVWEIEYFFFTLLGSRATELQGGNRGVLRTSTHRERYTYRLAVWPYKELLTHAGLTRLIHYINLSPKVSSDPFTVSL